MFKPVNECLEKYHVRIFAPDAGTYAIAATHHECNNGYPPGGNPGCNYPFDHVIGWEDAESLARDDVLAGSRIARQYSVDLANTNGGVWRGVNNDGSAQVLEFANHCGTVAADAVWASGTVDHVVDCNITVPTRVTLTLQAGAVVKFANSNSIDVDGTLRIDGEPNNRITITSVADSAAGQWGRLRIPSSGGSISIDNADIRDGGNSAAGAMIVNESEAGTLSVVDSTLHNSANNPVVLDNLRSGSNFTCSGTTASNNAQIGVKLQRMSTANVGLVSLPRCDSSLPYLVDGLLTVYGTLTFNPGTTVKFANSSSMDVQGTLRVDGEPTNRITITSVADSAAGQWGRLRIPSSGGSINIDNADIRNGGNSAAGAMIVNESSSGSVLVRDSNISASATTAVVNDSNAGPADARYNWWGAASGPANGGTQSCNPLPRPSGSGLPISCNVLFDPWFRCTLGQLCQSDADGLDDNTETACGSNPLNPNSRPERLDGAYANQDDDLDGAIDEPLPVGGEAYDCDGDGFSGGVEQYVFSAASPVSDQKRCGIDAWPADMNNNGFSDISDIALLTGVFGQSLPPAPIRYDIAPDPPPPPGGRFVDISDISKIVNYFGKHCSQP
ncbi:MAG: hypothetical protein E6J43_06095 [Chloroflexi bacterium]|nr:MAG: hypothetical protein E6J43_06095 [Chloroflexota bacterium]